MGKPSETTIHDIARMLKLSASTVSRALNNNPVIREKTRNLIIQKAQEMGYQPNVMAANLRTRRTNTIGVILPLINRHFFSSFVSGVEEVAYQEGFAVAISQSNDNFEKETRIARTFFTNRVDGLIVSLGMQTSSFDHLKVFADRGVPLAFFDRVPDEIEAHKIVVDDYRGGYMATQHLLEQGATRVAHIGGPLNLMIYHNRHKGYTDALKKAGIELDDSLVIHNQLTREDGTNAVKTLMQLPDPPDAVFCANDTTALSTILYLREKGIQVPGEVLVVGFSNEPFSEVVTPSISTIRQPGVEMGRKAAELLIEQIHDRGKTEGYKTIVMPTELIIRESSVRSTGDRAKSTGHRAKSKE
jgi:LacI family transcriptional regulator